MPKLIIGHKQAMTRQFLDSGRQLPVTVVAAGPCLVTGVRSEKQHGYRAVQLGYGQAKRLVKPQRGHLGELGDFVWLHEFRLPVEASFQVGQKLDVSQFIVGDRVKVAGWSKGKGFQGVVKRHGFHGHPTTHGHKDQARMPGSIGAGGVQHVRKGKRMAGRMGGQRVTVRNLEVVAVKPETNELWLKGAVPGARHGRVIIESVNG